MLSRPIYNFAAGPGVMPAAVLAQAQQELINWNGNGISMLEMPFTGLAFGGVLNEAASALRQLLNIPSNYHVLFMHGGASAQFSLVPLNLLNECRQADYIETGYWSKKTILEASRYCDVHIAASSAASNFSHLPDKWQVNTDASYCHFTSNETANGLQFHTIPDVGDVPLIADMTSDFLSKPIDITRYGLIYAGAQKNVGPAGLTIVIVRDDLLGKANSATPSLFNYQSQAHANSKINTPATFAIYLANLVFRWIIDAGGVAEMTRRSQQRSALIYAVIDASNGFYHCPIKTSHRSLMNICCTLADDVLTTKFLSGADAIRLINLKGHAMMGGIRISLYNAMPIDGVKALAHYMHQFAQKHSQYV